MSQRLQYFDALPEGLTACGARELAAHLNGPSMVRIEGKREPPLFVSVLLHGNETGGWEGVRRLLRESTPLPRSLLLFVGNVAAAAAGVRTLPDQQDYNRIWRRAAGPEGELAAAVLATLGQWPLFAAVDLHNNTGHNPHYAVLTNVSRENLGLAYLFGDKAVHVREPDTVMTRALAHRCPSVTLELGPIGDPRGEDRAFDYVKRCLTLDDIPPADPDGLQLFRTEARVHLPDDVDFGFAGTDESRALTLTGGLEGINFHPLAAGAEFARTSLALEDALHVRDVNRSEVTHRFFTLDRGVVRLRRPVTPAMYTVDATVIRQDCLCYFMEPVLMESLFMEP